MGIKKVWLTLRRWVTSGAIFVVNKLLITPIQNYIVKNLSDKALTGEGYALSKLLKIAVFTGERFIREVAQYGEYTTNKETYDEKARKFHEKSTEWLGIHGLPDMHGPGADIIQERKAFIDRSDPKHSQHSLAQVTFNNFTNLAWRECQPIDKMVHKACVDVLAETFYGFPPDSLDERCYELLAEVEHGLFHAGIHPSPRFFEMREELKKYNNEFLKKHEQNISPYNYLRYEQEKFPEKKIEDFNPLIGLIAAGNISILLSGIIIKLAENPTFQERLREELEQVNWNVTPENLYQNLKDLPFLDGLYKEGLRFFTVSVPVTRYVSKEAKIGGITIPADTTIFIPLSRILKDERCTWDGNKHWVEPEKFNPDREFPRLGQYPFIPFSEGIRNCPAKQPMVEKFTKMALAITFNRLKLALQEPLTQVETLPRYAFVTRLQNKYYCQSTLVQKDRESENSILNAFPLTRAPKVTPIATNDSVTYPAKVKVKNH